jgi:hypothetical protein
VADVLEAKGRRGSLDHLGQLASIAVYGNDRQLHEIYYRFDYAADVGYTGSCAEATD